MIRSLPLQRRIIAIVLFMGLFAQFQTVFACEYKDGKLQLVCCCDEPGDMSKGCDQDNSCNDSGVPVSNETCCKVSFQVGPSMTIIGSEQHIQQVLLLDAPQPPPLLASYDLQTIPISYQTNRHISDLPPAYIGIGAGTQTYQLTQRFRI